ncbi:MAG: hypothetical protein PHP04_09615 [Bacteroidales bacterium]|nr:hypothetical protein [Bacteroidales bacterium]
MSSRYAAFFFASSFVNSFPVVLPEIVPDGALPGLVVVSWLFVCPVFAPRSSCRSFFSFRSFCSSSTASVSLEAQPAKPELMTVALSSRASRLFRAL